MAGGARSLPVVFPMPGKSMSHRMTYLTLCQHDDGRWMWAVSYWCDQGGSSYAPLPKWGNYAETQDEALTEAIAELRERLTRDSADARAIHAWLDTLTPAQADLFGVAA